MRFARLLLLALASLPTRLAAGQETPLDDVTLSWKVDGGGGKPLSINGYAPPAAGAYPVYVWLTGTGMSSWSNDDKTYVDDMARRGFFAVSIEYESRPYPGNCGGFHAKARDIFDPTAAWSALAAVCAHAKADCGGGIAVSGFSQGANLASLGRNYNPNVRAACLVGNVEATAVGCYDAVDLDLPRERIRSVMGEGDGYADGTYATVRASLEATAGITCAAGVFDCLQPDGSGWFIVQSSDTVCGDDGHSFQYDGGCASNVGTLFDDNYWPDQATAFGMDRCHAWLASPGFYGPVAGVCGDGVRGAGEACDGSDLGSTTCADQGFDGGTLACAATCDSFVTDGCTTCGDGVAEGSEECDGADLGSGTCEGLGFDGGTLACVACAYDTGGCASADPCVADPGAVGCACEVDDDCNLLKCKGGKCRGRRLAEPAMNV